MKSQGTHSRMQYLIGRNRRLKIYFAGTANMRGHCTMKPLKDELIQSRLDEDELADFDKVKKLLDVKSNFVAILQMIKDEIMLEKVRNEWKQGNTDVVSALLTKLSDEGRLPLSEALMGITGTKTSSQLSILQNQFADIQSQLESIMYSVTKMVD